MVPTEPLTGTQLVSRSCWFSLQREFLSHTGVSVQIVREGQQLTVELLAVSAPPVSSTSPLSGHQAAFLSQLLPCVYVTCLESVASVLDVFT